MTDLDRQIKLAEKLADASGEIISGYFRKPSLQVETKIGEVSAIATIADREAETAMVEILVREAPEDGVIREEGENIPSKNGRYWVLDPIDGTASFVRGLPIFGTLIGLVEENNPSPSLGIVNQPILQHRWIGIRGKSVRFNREPLINPYAQRTNDRLADACLISTTPLMFVSQRQKAIAAKLQEICQRTAFGGDCYNYMALASGWTSMPVVILESDMKYYDFCALIPIIEGTGAIASDWAGNPLNPSSTEVLAASNRALWQQALAAIARQTVPGNL